MSSEDRREFIKKIAKGMVYAAPVIVSMSAPKVVMASHKPGHTGMTMGMPSPIQDQLTDQSTGTARTSPRSPGAIPPPGVQR